MRARKKSEKAKQFAYGIGDMARIAGQQGADGALLMKISDLMPEPTRNAGNQRRYDQASLERLMFIRHCRKLGFGLDGHP